MFVASGLVVIALLSVAMYRNGAPITGPFIFEDELEYFAYGRDLFLRADLSDHTQYGALYPAVAALLFHFGGEESVYSALRLFNIAILASSAIPFYLFARAICPEDRAIRLAAPVFAATTPFTALGYLIWADPLYYALFPWAVLLLHGFNREPRVSSGIGCGVLLALLFHAKLGAGLVVAVAAFVSVLALLALSPQGSRRQRLRPVLALLLSCAVLTVPAIIRNLALGSGPIGYAIVSLEVTRSMDEVGGLQHALQTFSSVFYQLSYSFVGTWGLLGVPAVMAIMRWRSMRVELRLIVLFVLTCLAGLVAMSAIGNSAFPGLGHWRPNGRYLAVLFPASMLLALCLLREGAAADRFERRGLIVAATLLGLVAALATPLHVVAPHGFVTNPDMALATWFIDDGKVRWRDRYDPTASQRIIFAALFAGLGIAWAFAAKSRGALLLLGGFVLMANIAASMAEHRYLRMIATSQAALNDAILFLGRQGADLRSDVLFDRKLEGGNALYIAQFWNRGVRQLQFVEGARPTDLARKGATPRYFVSPQDLALPKAFASRPIFVYRVDGDS